MKPVYYGDQTFQALKNFPFTYSRVHLELIYAIAEIKQAAAFANWKDGGISKDYCNAITLAAREIIQERFDDQFKLPGIQGGAGTSIHMNVNEVIARRATELLGDINTTVHPNDHVNRSQSTNDVNPSALRIALIRRSKILLHELHMLTASWETQAERYVNVPKLARTHMQDAIPTTFDQEFSSYATVITKDIARIEEAMGNLYELNIGGTAIGTGVNTSARYKAVLYSKLREITGLPLTQANNMMTLTSTAGDFVQLSGAVTTMAGNLSKIATDLRFLSSGPYGGIGEIHLKELQKGSSIMPGKVNPVLPESVNQMYYRVLGNNVTVQVAAEQSHLELAVMFPVIADTLLGSVLLSTSVIRAFRQNCVDTLVVQQDRARTLLEQSTAYATVFTPVLGYDVVSSVVKESITKRTHFLELLVQNGYFSEEELSEILNTNEK